MKTYCPLATTYKELIGFFFKVESNVSSLAINLYKIYNKGKAQNLEVSIERM